MGICSCTCVFMSMSVSMFVCMGMTVTLVKEFMMKDMIGILDNKRTRQDNALSAPDMQLGLKLLIAESVDECITLVKENAVASQTLEQALCEYQYCLHVMLLFVSSRVQNLTSIRVCTFSQVC